MNKYNIGDKFYYVYNDFDGFPETPLEGNITLIEDDHMIMHEFSFNMNLWISEDDINIHFFDNEEDAIKKINEIKRERRNFPIFMY